MHNHFSNQAKRDGLDSKDEEQHTQQKEWAGGDSSTQDFGEEHDEQNDATR